MELRRRRLLTIENHPSHPWFGRLLPGERDTMTKQELGQRTRAQYLARAKLRSVRFRIPIGDTRDFAIIASTEKQAVQRARFTFQIPKSWRAIAVDGRPYKE